jgi:outer membrane protein assembly factor BamD
MPLRVLFYCSLVLLLSGCATKVPGNKSISNYFSEGEELYKNKDYQESIAKWKKVKELGSNSPQLSALADLMIADSQFASKNYIEAAATYESFAKFHPDNDKVPYAAYRQALCNYMQISGIDRDQTPLKNTITLLKSFLRNYPDSEYADDAKKKLADCISKRAEHEIYIGRFYYRFGKYHAAIKRLEECIARYPDVAVTDEAYFILEKAYFETGEKERGKEAFNRLFIKFPTSKYIKEADSYLKDNE